jgi:hypothetical protein
MEINNVSTKMISNKIADRCLNIFTKESKYIVSECIHKIDILNVNNDTGV